MHLVRFQHFPEQLQGTDHFADRSALLMAVSDTGVLHALMVQSQEIRVAGKNDASSWVRKGDMIQIFGAKEPGIGRCGHVDATPAKAIRDGEINVLIKMKADGPGHPYLPIFA